MRTYKTGATKMTNEQLLNKVSFNHKYLKSDIKGTTPNLTKAIYFENLLKKRGVTEEEITNFCNTRYTADNK